MDKDFSILACFSISNDIIHKNNTHLIASVVYTDKRILEYMDINKAEAYKNTFQRKKKLIIIMVFPFLEGYNYAIAASNYEILIIYVDFTSIFLELTRGNEFKEDFWNAINSSPLEENDQTEKDKKKNFESLIRDSLFIFRNIV